MKKKEDTEDFSNSENKDAATFEKKGKDMGDGSGNAESSSPNKYKGFWEKWNSEMMKKSKDAKTEK